MEFAPGDLATTSSATSHPLLGGVMPANLMDLPGRERLERLSDAAAPLSGIQLVTGVRPVSASESGAVFELAVRQRLVDDAGRLPLGVIATLADGALGWAVVGALPAGSSCATVGLNLGLLRETSVGRCLRAEAQLVRLDERSAVSTGIVTDENGRSIADCRARSVVSSRGPKDGGGAPPRAVEPMTSTTVADITGAGVGGDLDGMAALRAVTLGERRADPVHDLLGIEVTEYAVGSATLSMAADVRVEQTMGSVQGGALALFADRALATAVRTTLAAGDTTYLIDLQMTFARAHAADGSPLTARAELRHRGRRLALAAVTVSDASSRVVAFGSGTATIVAEPSA